MARCISYDIMQYIGSIWIIYCEANGKIVSPSGIWTRTIEIPVRRSTNWAIEPNEERRADLTNLRTSNYYKP